MASLVVANLVPLVGVVGFDWNLHAILVVYWVESGVMGVAYVAKIRRAEGVDAPEELPSLKVNGTPIESFVGRPNWQIALFFTYCYGLFWIVHGVFVLSFPLFVFLFGSTSPAVASPAVVAAGAVGLVAYHAISYRINYVGDREYVRNGPVTLVVESFYRVVVLHLTIVVGAVLVAEFGAPLGAIVVMVLVKTVFDLVAHRREHERAKRRSPAPRIPT